MSPKKPAQLAVRTSLGRSPFDRVKRCVSAAMATHFGARGAAESGPAQTPTKKTTETPMKAKVSSNRVAEIASRILRDKPVTFREIKAVAGSVVAQAKAKARAKKKCAPKKRRR